MCFFFENDILGRRSIIFENERNQHNLEKKPSNASIRTQSIMAYSHHYLGIPWMRRGVLRDGEEADFITLKEPSNISELNFGDSRKIKGHVIKSAPTRINDKDCS